MFDALKSFPYSFIRKSKIESDLYECINRINNSFEELHKTIVLHTERKDIPIVIGDINLSCKKLKNYVVYHTKNQEYKVRSDMNTEFEKYRRIWLYKTAYWLCCKQ